MSSEEKHFGQSPLRKAEFIKPEQTIKKKVGSGGLSESILNKAQAVIEENQIDFTPMAKKHITALKEGISTAEEMGNHLDTAPLIEAMLMPAMQLKANGGMFQFHLVSQISGRLVHFLEVVDHINEDSLDVIKGFYTALNALISGQIRGEGGKSGQELYNALNDACYRYFSSHN